MIMRALRRLPVVGGSDAAPPPEREQSSIEFEISRLEHASLDELRLNWRNRWGRLAPAHIPRGLLFRLMAYRIQAEAFGDLDRNSVKMLDRLGRDSSDEAIGLNRRRDDTTPVAPRRPGRPRKGTQPAPLTVKPGAILTREWRGRIERVMALEHGFAWNGETYPSLSAIALAITGVKWSGRRFFFGAKGRGGGAEGGPARSPVRSKRKGSDHSSG